ncbi:hypothetical protein C8Q76DRAFT_853185 [Earliella scabrosa]|nr:hypothetical protein C8Q76DRAFT_853185 [Earliella scabrosa]
MSHARVQAVLASFLPLLPLFFSNDKSDGADWTINNPPDPPPHPTSSPSAIQAAQPNLQGLAHELNQSLNAETLADAVFAPVDDTVPVLDALRSIRDRLLPELESFPVVFLVGFAAGVFLTSLLCSIAYCLIAYSRTKTSRGSSCEGARTGDSYNVGLELRDGEGHSPMAPAQDLVNTTSKVLSTPVPDVSLSRAPSPNASKTVTAVDEDSCKSACEDVSLVPFAPAEGLSGMLSPLLSGSSISSATSTPMNLSQFCANVAREGAALAGCPPEPNNTSPSAAPLCSDMSGDSSPPPQRSSWSLEKACDTSMYADESPESELNSPTCQTPSAQSTPVASPVMQEQPAPQQYRPDVDDQHDININILEAIDRERVLSDITERTEPCSDGDTPNTPRARWFSGIHKRVASLDGQGLTLSEQTALAAVSAGSSPEVAYQPSPANMSLAAAASVLLPRTPPRNREPSLGLAIPDVPSDVDDPDAGDESEQDSISSVSWSVLDDVSYHTAGQAEPEDLLDAASIASSSWDLEDAPPGALVLDEATLELHPATDTDFASDWSIVGSPSRTSSIGDADQHLELVVPDDPNSHSRSNSEKSVVEPSSPTRTTEPVLNSVPFPASSPVPSVADGDDSPTTPEEPLPSTTTTPAPQPTGNARSSKLKSFGKRVRRATSFVVARFGMGRGQQVSLTPDGMDYVAERAAAASTSRRRRESFTTEAINLHGDRSTRVREDREVLRERRASVEPVTARGLQNIIDGAQNPPLANEVQIRREIHEVGRSRTRQDSRRTTHVRLERSRSAASLSSTVRAPLAFPATQTEASSAQVQAAPTNASHTSLNTLASNASISQNNPLSYASVAARPPPRARTVSEQASSTTSSGSGSAGPLPPALRRAASAANVVDAHTGSRRPLASSARAGPSAAADPSARPSKTKSLADLKGKARAVSPVPTDKQDDNETTVPVDDPSGPVDRKGKGRAYSPGPLAADSGVPSVMVEASASGSSLSSRLSRASASAFRGGGALPTGTKISLRKLAEVAQINGMRTGMISTVSSESLRGRELASGSGSTSAAVPPPSSASAAPASASAAIGSGATAALILPGSSPAATDLSAESSNLATPLRKLMEQVHTGQTQPPTTVADSSKTSPVEGNAPPPLLLPTKHLASALDPEPHSVDLVTTSRHIRRATPTDSAVVCLNSSESKTASGLVPRRLTTPLILATPSGADAALNNHAHRAANVQDEDDEIIVWHGPGRSDRRSGGLARDVAVQCS